MTVRLRLGVVLVIPPPVGTEVDGLRRALGSRALGRIPPHVTLVPPTNIPASQLDRALEVLRDAAGSVRPLRLELGPPASFWPANPVVYLSVGGPGLSEGGPGLSVGGPGLSEVERLRRAVSKPPLDRPADQAFVAHVTIADNVGPELIPPALSLLGAYRAEVSVTEVHLLVQRAGQVWETLGTARLSAPAVIGRGGLATEVSGTPDLDAHAAAWASAAWASCTREDYGEGAVPDQPFAFTARRARQTVGTVEGFVRSPGSLRPVAEISRLIVDPTVRGEGVGSHLLAAVESMAAESGGSAVRVLTRAASPAEGFYLHRGFVVTDTLIAWSAGRDFVVMERRLA
ncbi:MAG: GNAT family N-acetyltransferase [Acidimicrobiales bacterium]